MYICIWRLLYVQGLCGAGTLIFEPLYVPDIIRCFEAIRIEIACINLYSYLVCVYVYSPFYFARDPVFRQNARARNMRMYKSCTVHVRIYMWSE